MAFTFSGVTPTTIAREGGVLLTLTGSWPFAIPIKAYIGPLGTALDPACYAGVPGQGATLYALTTSTLQLYTPVIASGLTMVALTLVSGTQTQTIPAAFTVVNSLFYSQVYSLRAQLNPNWAVGARDFSHESALP